MRGPAGWVERLGQERARADLFGGGSLQRLLAFDHARARLFPKRPPRPRLIQLEPARDCNLRCVMCLRDTGEKVAAGAQKTGAEMRLALFRDLVLRHFPYRHFLLLYGQGEPLLCRDLIDMIRFEKERGNTVASTTNGTLLDQGMADEIAGSGLDALRVSVDGASELTFQQVRGGGSLARVCAGVDRLRRAVERRKGGTRLALTFMALRENYTEMVDMVRLTSDLGLPMLELKSLPLYRDSPMEPLGLAMIRDARIGAEVDALLRSARREAKRLRVRLITGRFGRSTLRPFCLNPWHKVFVDAEGTLYPCSKLCLSPEAALGSLVEQDFAPLWIGHRYTSVRLAVRAGRAPFSGCVPADHGEAAADRRERRRDRSAHPLRQS